MYERRSQAGNPFIAAVVGSSGGDVLIWPENWPAFEVFSRVSTQWFSGFGGPTGLRYEALYPLLDRIANSPEEWDELFDDVQTMERAALEVMQEANNG